MYCKKCGTELSFDARFCPTCGEKVYIEDNISCPRCSHIVSKKDRFCKTCGYDLLKIETPTEQYDVGALLNNIKNEGKAVKHESDSVRLRPYKILTSIITLICGVLFLLLLFLPVVSSHYNIEYLDLINFELAKDLNSEFITKSGTSFSISSFNIVSFYKIFFCELTNGTASAFTVDLLNHVGLFVYGTLALISTLIAAFSIVVIIYSIIGIIKKTAYNKCKLFVGLVFALALCLFFGLGNPGLGTWLIGALSFLLLIYFYVIEIISKEKKYDIKRFISKSILVVLLTVSIILIGFGTFIDTDNLINVRFDNDIKECNTSLLSQVILQMVYVTDPKYSSSITNIYVWLTSFALFAGAIAMFCLCYSLAFLLVSYSNHNLPFPVRKIFMSLVFICIVTTINSVFVSFVNKSEYVLYTSTMSPSEIEALSSEEINSTRIFKNIPTIYFATLGIFISSIYSLFAKKIIIKTEL